ncbi:TonB-dependent receptor [Algoriphagus sp. D3-2-R+10]|uniref:TonB-dependent receptor n=1 Tax=Algoriphagus aurantiacus TaxID=3103948 RepID=UPI002B3ACD5E|nr:TonB-dependent receptor [Algoriphagus sp. D3-2-R+10]MEB2778043.1 TonB-dependent receptor [Algoriphagus sp. D3-2-R+10]
MKKLAKTILLTGIIGLTSGWAFSQTQQRGAVTDQEFVIRKDRVLTVPVQPRMYEKLPVLPKPTELNEYNYLVTSYPLNLKPLDLKAEPSQKVYSPERLDLYPGYIRAGYGNFASPLLEARYMGIDIADFNYSLQLNHQSYGKGPVLAEESKESHTNLGFDGSYFTDLFEVFGGIKWNQDSFQFYGLDPNHLLDDNGQFTGFDGNVLSAIEVKAGIRELEKVGPISYEGQLNFRNFTDSYMVKENQFGAEASLTFRPTVDWAGKVGLSYFTTNPEDLTYSLKRTYFAVRPTISYKYEAFNFTAGLNLVSENDSLENKSSDFHVFPVLKASYQFAEEFGFFGEFSGDVQRNTYYSFVNENPYLGPSEQLLNTVQNYKIEGGIEGQFQGAFSYRAAVNVSRYNQMHFFVNNYTNNLVTTDSARFSLVYDDKTTVYNINAELGYKFSDMYSLNGRLDLYQYDLSTQAEAWNRPIWELSVNNQFTPIERLIVQANLNLMGGIKARGTDFSDTTDPGPYDVVKLKTIADLQLKADYGITDRISIFAEGNNLLNGKNMRWLNYPVRGIQFIGGASFKF